MAAHGHRQLAHKTGTQIDPRLVSEQIDKILLYGTFGVLLFGPIAFGAVEPWSMFVLETSSVLLLLLWFAKQLLEGELNVQWNPLFPPMAVFGVLVILQIVTRRSTYLHDTLSGGLLYGAYAMLCFLSAQTLLRASQARRLSVIFSLYGFVLAALALLQDIAPNGKLLWFRQPRMGGWIFGSYVNHNHYAGLMELLMPIPLVLSFNHMLHHKERNAARIAAATMAGTVFLSGSRGGMLAILVEFTLLAVILVRYKKGGRTALGVGVFAVVVVCMLTWLGGTHLIERVSSISTETRTEITGGMRLSIDRDAFRMFLRKPLIGWGLRTFPVVYPQFRSFYTNFFVNEAHNDYLQLLTEMGLLGFGTMLWFVVVLYHAAFRKIGNWTSDVSGAATVACMLAFTGILVHSLFDFNLQIPANAALFYVFCTIAASPPLLHRARKRKPEPTQAAEVLPASEAG